MSVDTAKTFIDETTAAGISTPGFLAIVAQEGASLRANNWINHYGYGFGSVGEGVKADASYMHDMAMKSDDHVVHVWGWLFRHAH
ncbi:hypothetical protein [Weissella confusa]|uniref:hypothetical protein n=1 Tax=Weissella confusa TaxID=1583 RepID=UPI00107F2194|nr:hypothetical protein [Weissella confusa]TGE71879.1 hypothetical protein C6P10_10915 [Weissella confusa]